MYTKYFLLTRKYSSENWISIINNYCKWINYHTHLAPWLGVCWHTWNDCLNMSHHCRLLCATCRLSLCVSWWLGCYPHVKLLVDSFFLALSLPVRANVIFLLHYPHTLVLSWWRLEEVYLVLVHFYNTLLSFL